jgi:prophage regulatory protein
MLTHMMQSAPTPPTQSQNEHHPPSALPAEGYVRLRTILALLPISHATWWRGVKSGRFPAPVRLGAKITAWRVADIRRLLAAIDAEGLSDFRPAA